MDKIFLFVCFTFFILSSNISYSQIFINEILSKNESTNTDESGAYEDWIELYNAGSEPIDINGFYFSDDINEPTLFQIQSNDPNESTIQAGGFLLLWVDKDTEEGALHLDFSLSSSGESIYIWESDGTTLVDSITFPALNEDISYGRNPDGASTFQEFISPSPNASNGSGVPTYQALLRTKINSGNNDAEEPFDQTYITLNDPSINIVEDWSGNQSVGFRFEDIGLPAEAVINKAYLQFSAASSWESIGPANFTITGEASTNSQVFEGTHNNISARPRTNQSITWQPEEWNDIDERESKQQSPDLTVLIQEILALDNWNINSPLTFILEGSGKRIVHAFEGDAHQAAELIIEAELTIDQSPITNLFINEIAPAGTYYQDESGKHEDWLELYNGGNESINIGGLFLTDDAENLTQWQIAYPYLLAPGEFAVLFIDKDPEEGGLHANFNLNTEGETLVLSQLIDNNLQILDSISYPEMALNASYGRVTDGADTWVKFGEVTPNNSNNGALAYLSAPSISLPSGIYESMQEVMLSHPLPDVNIHYTLDGREPTLADPIYTSPINIIENASLNARAYKEGYAASLLASASYLFYIDSALPTLFINTDPANFFDDSIGIYVEGSNGIPGYCTFDSVNWNRAWERPINFSMFLPDGSEAFDVKAGIQIAGGCSRLYPQKSLNIYLRDNQYGSEYIDYPIFEGRDYDKYERLKLRNSGQDFLRTMYRDGLVHSLLWDKIEMDLLAFQPSLLYLNGEFWGIYNMRESFNDEYYENNHDIDKDDLDLIFNPGMQEIASENVKNGNTEKFYELYDFVKDNDLQIPDNYDFVKDRLDIDQTLNYWIFSAYIAKGDWPANNVLMWRERKQGKKWRYSAVDHDNAIDNGINETSRPSYNTLAQILVDNSTDWPNHSSSTVIFRKLLENDAFKDEFIQRTATFMKLIFNEERTTHYIDSLSTMIEPHIPQHIEKYGAAGGAGGSVFGWETWNQAMKDFFVERPSYYRDFLRGAFDLGDTYNLTINYDETTPGKVEIHSNKMDIPYNFTNSYFKNVPVRLKAKADDGYQFVRWEETGSTDEIYYFTGTEDQILTPIFEVITSLDNPIEEKGFILAPNPNDGNFAIDNHRSISKPISVTLFDLNGKIQFSKVYPSTARITIQTPMLPKGLYLVQCVQGNFIETQKVMIK